MTNQLLKSFNFKKISIPIIILVCLIVLILLAIILNLEVVSHLRDEYDITFKALTLILIIVGIILALSRMRQTDDQIKELSENNKLNNFFKHRAEFIRFFSGNENFKSIAGGEVKHLKNMLMDYYEYFFAKSYSKFTATLNDDALLECNHFISNMNKTKLIQHEINLFDLKKEEVFEATLPPAFPIFYISEYLSLFLNQKDYRFKDYNGVNSAEQKEIYFQILKVYFIYIIIAEVSSFSGEMETIKFPENLYINIMMYLEELGIDDGLISP